MTAPGFQLGLSGYPSEVVHNGDRVAKSALQYIENHDHSRFVCNFGVISCDGELFQEGNRDRWYKIQPCLIALLTAKGIPMLWQGQEFGENYWIPDSGYGRCFVSPPST